MVFTGKNEMEEKQKRFNDIKLYSFTALLGATVGAVIWLFLRLVGICTELIWETLPKALGVSFLPLILCTAAGLCAGLIHRKHGEYPEELAVVLGKIKRDRHYGYDSMFVMLVCAFIPLVFGASVGPEAGLTGIIAGLCYWVGDNVTYAKEDADEYSDIGAAVTLGNLFHVPLFGIFAVEEGELGTDGGELPRSSKLLLYGISTAAAFLVMKGLGALLGPAGEGFPSFEFMDISRIDYLMTLVYIPVGLLLFFFFEKSELLCGKAAERMPAVIRETVCGLGIGIMALAAPVVLFSGEEQMAELAENFGTYAAAALIGISLLKLFMTAFCIKLGLKGGHFFPVIFACSCMGFGIAAMIFSEPLSHAVFAAAVITASMLGAQMKKPIAVSMLLLICFPVRLILWILLGAAAGGRLGEIMHKRME